MTLPISINPYAIPGIDRVHYNADLHERLLAVVCKATGQKQADIKSMSRKGQIPIARHLFIYFLASMNSRLTDEEIGQFVRSKDLRAMERTSVIHAKKNIQNAIDVKDKMVLQYIERIKSLL